MRENVEINEGHHHRTTCHGGGELKCPYLQHIHLPPTSYLYFLSCWKFGFNIAKHGRTQFSRNLEPPPRSFELAYED